MLNTVQTFLNDERGATAVEYGLIAVLICVALLGGARSLGLSINLLWDNNADKISEVMDDMPG